MTALRYRKKAIHSQHHYQSRLLEALAQGPGTIGDMMARVGAPGRLGPSYGWAAVQLQAQGKVVRSDTRPYVWRLAADGPAVARAEGALQLVWQRRQTAGGTWRLELTATCEGAPRWSTALPAVATPEEQHRAEARARAFFACLLAGRAA